ncbi:LytR/AlgR family response regulator transcription factor [Jiulongibacter sediminis]|nr:LytTR family DNA-binding domain-containing protein [Jiulongibacter sediminis]
MKTSIHVGGRMAFNPTEIAWLEADINYTRIHLISGRKTVVATTLGVLEERFKAYGFVRPNRKAVVNKQFILKTEEKSLLLKDQTQLTISRRREVVL